MVILGAGGHSVEIYDILRDNGYTMDIRFFDNTLNSDTERFLADKPIISDVITLKHRFSIQSDYSLGVGKPATRVKLNEIAINNGGQLKSVIASTASIGSYNIELGEGLNIMHHSIISSCSTIEQGVLINARTNVHHHCHIGQYSEIGPGCILCGNVSIGAFCSIGAGVTILPGVHVGPNITIGAGSVVTKDLNQPGVYLGVPVQLMKD